MLVWALGSFALLLGASSLLSRYLSWNELRTDLVRLNDPVLKVVPFCDVRRWLSPVLFVNVGVLVVHIAVRWDMRGWTLHNLSFVMMLVLRCTCIWLCPLAIHADGRRVRDLLLDKFTPSYKNDLLFSGHVAHLFILGVIFAEFRWFFWTSSFATAAMLLAIRAHYAIDVFLAPFMGFCAVTLTRTLTSL